MSVETEVALLTTATTNLLSQVQISRNTLDNNVAQCENAVTTAQTQVPLAQTQATNAATQATAAAAQATAASSAATNAGTAATAAATTLISAVTQRPALRPSLSVDWTLRPTAAALTAAGWTVSRAGEMTYFGPVPVKVAENLFVRSADFTNASWAKSLATVSAVTDESGLVGVKLVGSTDANAYHRAFQVCAALNLGSTTYRVRFLCKSSEYTKVAIGAVVATGHPGAAFDLATGATIGSGYGTGYVSHSITPHEFGGGLYWCEVVLTSPPAGVIFSPTVGGYPDSGATLDGIGPRYTGDGVSGIEVYAAQLQHNFDGDYVPTTDVTITQYANPLLTAAANELAYQHNSRGECVGLLQYPADTNLILQSQNLAISWAASLVAVTATKRLWAGVAPFWRLSKTDATGSASLTQVVFTSVSAGSKYSASIALLGDRWSAVTTVQVGLVGLANGTWGNNADSTAVIISGPGTLTQASGSLYTVSGLSYDIPTLIRITRTYPLADDRTSINIYPGGSTSTTIGAAILATRVHLSASPRYMPYIPTTTAAVTRGTQTIMHTTAGSLTNPQEGTLLSRASVEDAVFTDTGSPQLVFGPLPGGSGGAVQIDTSSANNVLMGYASAYGAQQAACIAPTARYGTTPVTGAFSYAKDGFMAAFNGELTTQDITGIVPVTNCLRAGPGVRGLVQRSEVYPRAMTSTELSAITTPGVLI